MTRRRRAEYTQEAPQVNGGKLGNSGYSTQIRGWDATVAREESHPYKRGPGEVPEWSIGTVSKTVVRASVPWVRIPPSPPFCFALRCENVRALAGKNYALLKEDPCHASHEHAHR